jgi:hypothetical protein
MRCRSRSDGDIPLETSLRLWIATSFEGSSSKPSAGREP